MGKGNFGKLERTFDRHAGSIDRSIAREKKLKELGVWKAEKEIVYKHPDDQTFFETYPIFGKWETALEEIAPLSNALTELRDYGGLPKKPGAPLDYIKELYQQQLSPREAWAVIKDKLYW
jgi:hypothetical protein